MMKNEGRNSYRKVSRRVVVAITLILLCFPLMVSAEEKPPSLQVESIYGRLALYHWIRLRVTGLREWSVQGNTAEKLVLYIDGNPIPGLTATILNNDAHNQPWDVQFDLKRISGNEDNRKAWNAVLSREKGWSRMVPVTLGVNGAPVPTKVSAPLTVILEGWFWVFVIVFLLAILGFWFLARVSDVLRDAGPDLTGVDEKGKKNRKPYSLARTQMALWFFIVVISFVFIWMVTSDTSNLTPSVLALIGISAATGLGAAIVDSSKRSEQEGLRASLDQKRKAAELDVKRLTDEIASLDSTINANPPPADIDNQRTLQAAKKAELAAKNAEVTQTKTEITNLDSANPPAVTKGFIRDILSDDDGVSFHRFQIFAWTIVLIAVFIASVYHVLAMPDFDAVLLGLMGISGGTYIGFKLPNQQG